MACDSRGHLEARDTNPAPVLRLPVVLSLSPLRSEPNSDHRFALPEQCWHDAAYHNVPIGPHSATPAAPQQSIDSNTLDFYLPSWLKCTGRMENTQ